MALLKAQPGKHNYGSNGNGTAQHLIGTQFENMTGTDFSHIPYKGSNPALMDALGIQARFCDAARPWAGWQSSPDPRPLLLIGRPFDGQPHAPGNGQMTAFLAASRAMVDQAHAVALAHGGRCDGPPGLRPRYHAHYYGAFVIDPEGNIRYYIISERQIWHSDEVRQCIEALMD